MFYLVIQTRSNFGSGATIRKRGRVFLARRVRRVDTEESGLLVGFDEFGRSFSSLFVILRKKLKKVYLIVKMKRRA